MTRLDKMMKDNGLNGDQVIIQEVRKFNRIKDCKWDCPYYDLCCDPEFSYFESCYDYILLYLLEEVEEEEETPEIPEEKEKLFTLSYYPVIGETVDIDGIPHKPIIEFNYENEIGTVALHIIAGDIEDTYLIKEDTLYINVLKATQGLHYLEVQASDSVDNTSNILEIQFNVDLGQEDDTWNDGIIK